jgi:hypothetical protein
MAVRHSYPMTGICGTYVTTQEVYADTIGHSILVIVLQLKDSMNKKYEENQ